MALWNGKKLMAHRKGSSVLGIFRIQITRLLGKRHQFSFCEKLRRRSGKSLAQRRKVNELTIFAS